MSMEPPPPPTCPPPPLEPPTSRKQKLYQAVAAGRTAVEGDHEEPRIILSQRENCFRKELQWLLCNKYVPSLIQDGPQCGLVALWMAAHLLQNSQVVSMETLVQTAVDKGYTIQGEMFSASDMAALAEEVLGCRAETLTGGMMGENNAGILRHLTAGQPVLIPYDDDFNHEPCLQGGHRAHWAVASGVVLGLTQGSLERKGLEPDPILPWLLIPEVAAALSWPEGAEQEVYVLAKQGKSLRYQLWSLASICQSNAQLLELDPKRAGDGTCYVVPPGGVGEGLAGQVVLLHPQPL